MNSAGISILLFLVFVVMFLPRRLAVLGMIAGVLYLTQAQRVMVMDFNVFAFRFLELAGFVRIMARGESSFSKLNPIDRAFLLLYSYLVVVYTLRATEGQAFVVGLAVDAFLCYFTFRGLIRNIEDLHWLLRALVLLLAPFTVIVLIESLTQNNLFSLMGGGLEGWVRGQRFRSVGSLRNPTLLGTLGAVFIPLYIGLAQIRIDRRFAFAGLGLCVIIVWASNSGGPIGAAAIGMVGWAFWKARLEMRRVRWGIVATIVLLALVMKAPVWYVLERVSQITGGDGYSRAFLIQISFQHLGEWWLAGMPLPETKGWFPYYHPLTGGSDITNQFISFGLTAGLGAIALFILLLTRAFSRIGVMLAEARADVRGSSEIELLYWGLGVTLATHIFSWLGITYFDQIYVIWFLQLAAISSLSPNYAVAGKLIEVDEAIDSSEVTFQETEAIGHHVQAAHHLT